MHEVSIAESILDLLERRIGAVRKLSEVELRVGPLSGVSADALLFCFGPVARERGFGDPSLRIERTEVEVRCEACGSTVRVDDPVDPCPRCGSWKRTILGGDELDLLAATMEEE